MPTVAAGFVFTPHERRRLAAALRRVRDARHCRRLQAVLLVAAGRQAGEVTALLKASRRWVTKTLARYCRHRDPGDLAESLASDNDLPVLCSWLTRRADGGAHREMLARAPLAPPGRVVAWRVGSHHGRQSVEAALVHKGDALA